MDIEHISCFTKSNKSRVPGTVETGLKPHVCTQQMGEVSPLGDLLDGLLPEASRASWQKGLPQVPPRHHSILVLSGAQGSPSPTMSYCKNMNTFSCGHGLVVG